MLAILCLRPKDVRNKYKLNINVKKGAFAPFKLYAEFI